MLSLYLHQVNDSAARSARELASQGSPEGGATRHTPVSLEVSLDGWWEVTGDWRKCPSEVLPASTLQALLGHAWTRGEEGQAEAGGGGGQDVEDGGQGGAESGSNRPGASWRKRETFVGSSRRVESTGPGNGDTRSVDEMRAEVMKLCDSLVYQEVLNP